MNTEALTTPSPELKQHAQDLKDHATQGAKDIKKDVGHLAKDVKDHANRSVDILKDEANSRLGEFRGRATDLVQTVKDYASENPLHAFGVGVLIGLFLARRRR